MGIEVGTALIASALIGGATAAYSAHQQGKAADAQASAQDTATKQAQKTASQQEQATNKANQKAPDTAALLAANQMAAGGGNSSTLLTGPSGVDPSLLNLGKNTLLGGGS